MSGSPRTPVLLALGLGLLTALPRTGLAQASNTFEAFVRFSAEKRVFATMAVVNGNSTSYYRDVFVGGETFTANPNDGDTISATVTDASGATSNFDPFVFHLNFNGQQNCWVSTFNGTLCNAPDIDVIWFRSSQCAPTGTWKMSFTYNSASYSMGTFQLLPQIPPDAITTIFNQGNYPTDYDTWCYYVDLAGNRIAKSNHTCNATLLANERQFTIKQKGCYLSDTAMVLNYFNVTADPPGLNDQLNAVRNGYQGGSVNPRAVANYGTGQGTQMTFLGATSDLYNAICTYGPQLAGVHCVNGTPGHWVLVTGRDVNKTTWLIDDPNGGVSSTLAARYPDGFCTTRTFSGPEHTFTTQAGLTVTFHSPVELLLTDPLGRRVGRDPVTGQVLNEIPGAYYDAGGLDDDSTGVPGTPDDEPTKILDVPTPTTGVYSVAATGTADGTYNADFIAYDVNGTASESDLRNVPIALNAVQTFTIQFDGSAGSQIQLSGGFNGGGQRPRDVNHFLTYGNPADSPVSLPAGTQSFPLMVFYAPVVLPATFSAQLNGVDVTGLFHPTAGQSEVVNLPLVSGTNVLKVSIDGNLPNRVATDTDRLVFSVP